jgi:hypothetical protein
MIKIFGEHIGVFIQIKFYYSGSWIERETYY